MLAATPATPNDSLDLFRLALSMIKVREQNIPQSLKDYLLKVLAQAKMIASDPRNIPPEVLPESIELAVELRATDALLDDLKPVQEIGGISPELAQRLLDEMEVHSVYQNGFDAVKRASH